MSSNVKAKKPSAKSLPKKLAGTRRRVSAEDFDSETGRWVPYTFGNPPSVYFALERVK